MSIKVRGVFVLIIIVMALMQVKFIDILAGKVVVVDRLTETNDDEGTRLYGAVIAMESFAVSPIIGVGYNRVMQFARYGTRTNMQYPQILASGGIILFFIYFLLIFKLFMKNIKLVLNNKIVFSITAYVLILFLFRRADMYFGVMATIVYHQVRKNGGSKAINV